MRVLRNKSLLFLLVILFARQVPLSSKPLLSGIIVEIISQGELTYNNPVWVSPSNWKMPEVDDGPFSDRQGDYELMVGESPTRDPQRPEVGCQLMMISSVDGANKITYNNPVTISALSSYLAEGWQGHNHVFDEPRVWRVSDTARHEYGVDVFASHPSNKATQSGQQLFALISPTEKTGVVDTDDVFWIVSNASGKDLDARVWPNSTRFDDPYYKLEVGDRWGIEKGGGDRSIQRGRFKVQVVNRDDLDKTGKKVYDKALKIQTFEDEVNPPRDCIKIPWFADRVAVGLRAQRPTFYCIDTNGDLFQLDEKNNAWFYVTVKTKDGKNIPLKDVSMSPTDGKLYVIGRDGRAYRYKRKKDFFQPLRLGDGNDNLRLDYITVGSRFNIRAVDLSTNTTYKYRRRKKNQAQSKPPGWIKKEKGRYIAAGKKGLVVRLDQNGQAFTRRKIRQKGKKKFNRVWKKIAGANLIHVATGKRKHIWGINDSGQVVKIVKNKWIVVRGANGKAVTGFSALDIDSKGNLILTSKTGDTYYHLRPEASKKRAIKKRLTKKKKQRLSRKKIKASPVRKDKGRSVKKRLQHKREQRLKRRKQKKQKQKFKKSKVKRRLRKKKE